MAAQETKIIVLNKDFGERVVGKNEFGVYDELPNSDEPLAEILKKQQQFRVSKTRVASYFANSSGHWLRFRLVSNVNQVCMLDLGLYTTDALELYAIFPDGKYKEYPKLNWKTPIAQRPIESPRFAYPLELKKGEVITFYLRGKSIKGTFKLSLNLLEPSIFEQNERSRLAFYSFFIGVMLIAFLLSFSFFIISKDFSYLYYSLFVVALVMHNLILGGYMSRFLLESYPSLADTMNANLFTPVFGIFNVRFLQLLLLDKEKSPRWIFMFGKLLVSLSMLIIALLITSRYHEELFFFIAHLFYVYYFFILVHQVSVIGLGFTYNPNNAKFVALSNLPFISYISILILTNLGVFQPNYIPQFGILSCLLFDIIILSVGLAVRFRHVARRELELLKQINHQLSMTFEAESKQKIEQIKRLEAQNKLQTEKERISRDLHDNIGSQLTFITSNLDYYSSKLNENEFRQKLTVLGDYVRQTTQQLRDTIWAINKEEIWLGELIKRINNYSLKQFENSSSIEFDCKFDESLSDIRLSSSLSLNLFRTIQEAINNIQKHSQATLFTLSIYEESENIVFKISDNGIGFDTKKTFYGHYGLENMKNRINELGGLFFIESNPKRGTTIILSFENTPKSVLINSPKNS